MAAEPEPVTASIHQMSELVDGISHAVQGNGIASSADDAGISRARDGASGLSRLAESSGSEVARFVARMREE